jgi:hypothetical protein
MALGAFLAKITGTFAIWQFKNKWIFQNKIYYPK